MNAVGGIYFICPNSNGPVELHDLPEERAHARCRFLHPITFAGDNFRFDECTFQSAWFSNGSVSMHGCEAKTVRAAKHILLVRTSVENVEAGGDVYVAECRSLKTITAGGTIFCKHEQALDHCKLTAKRIVTSLPRLLPDRAYDFFLESITCRDDVVAHRQARQFILVAAICSRDVIFPIDSIVPDEDRSVILRNGSAVKGRVIRGRLIDENPTVEAHPAAASSSGSQCKGAIQNPKDDASLGPLMQM